MGANFYEDSHSYDIFHFYKKTEKIKPAKNLIGKTTKKQ